MEKRTFTVVPLSHLSNENANSLFKSTCDVAIPVKTELGDMVGAVLDTFLPNARKFGEQVIAQRKSKLTEPVKAMDKKDDDLLAEIKRNVVFMSKSREADKKAAAQDLNFFFTPYWDVARKPIKTQADDLTDMFLKYHADQALPLAATLIGVAGIITELETSNAELTTTYLDRNEEMGARSSSGSDLRPPATEGYVDFCNAVEQAVNFMPTGTIITLFNNMDALRKKFKPLASGGKDKPTDNPPTE